MNWQIIYGSFCFAVLMAADVLIDNWKFRKNKSINHRWEAFVRGVMLLPSIYLLCKATPLLNASTVLTTIVVVGMEFFVYWTLFDGFYNLARKRDWWFLGSDDGVKNDAWLDRLLMEAGPELAKWIKLIGCAICIGNYIFSFYYH